MSPSSDNTMIIAGDHLDHRSLESIEHELELNLRKGLITIGILAALSVYSCLVLLVIIATRFYREWKRRGTAFGHNQYVVLVFNLLVADLIQSIGFLITWHWYLENDIVSPSAACYAQGWMIHSGDLSSGFFVLTIAMHTYFTGVYGGRLGHRMFRGIIAGVWTFAFLLTVIGVGMHTDQYFERAGAWCWVAARFDHDRLWLHYFWVFLVQFGTIILYLLTFVMLRQRTRQYFPGGLGQANNPSALTAKKINRIAILMMLYPGCYILLTLPLSVGRMWSMAHDRTTDIVFSCIAGSLMTSCGWVDCLLYALTRRRLLRDTMPHGPGQETPEHQSPPQRSNSVMVTTTTEVRVSSAAPQNFQMMPSPHDRESGCGPQSMHSGNPPHSRHQSTDPMLSNQAPLSRIQTRISGGQHRQSSSDEGVDEEHELHTWEKFLNDVHTGRSR